ncbi:hypothetical protein [Rhizobium ruizarguesonis]|uniref:hypothetical protein n=1 Tax=Rhizobium ruizarguesonis TaxID=2081791 RepID=UPI00103235D5|nr:hypothetical protein [Rhizobium ruizarguesonis]TAZ88140.1 hypothetical protein ELH67_32040 [Rhizobium ruizarguesonis]TBA29478.1 hypothetical protein ELH60_32305 [Rhizobium ruizarguesonis]TBA73874.1 hypothetical protein ELH56_31455 [Rhizobium ruizarguesonis]TBC54116.1 hypothetical protein ELH36_31845 [Rhizobium ruizarguesonis]
MTSSTRKPGIITATVAIATLAGIALVHPIGTAFSQQMPMTNHAMSGDHQMPGMMQHMMQMHGQGGMQTGVNAPTMAGQDAFGAIQEIVRILEADPSTDWSKVNLETLRQHLIDMNEVTLRANAASASIDGGLAIAVTGEGRTLAAIQRMVPDHAQELNQMNGWVATTEALPDGVRLTVTSNDSKEVAHIRGLGFIGLLVSGSHHQPHHLAMARNEMVHQH